MLGKNHLITACAGWLLMEPHIIHPQVGSMWKLGLLGVVAISSVLPDIDCPTSALGRRLKFISTPLSFLQGDKHLIFKSKDGHSRGFTHSIWILLLCWWGLYSWSPSGQHLLSLAFAFGFSAHLIGDALTPAGVGLFWPLTIKTRGPITFKTGGAVEYFITYSFAAAALAVYFLKI